MKLEEFVRDGKAVFDERKQQTTFHFRHVLLFWDHFELALLHQNLSVFLTVELLALKKSPSALNS